MKRSRKLQKGSAIVLAMFAVLIIYIMGVALLQGGFTTHAFAIRNSQQIKARVAADAALAKALNVMNQLQSSGELDDYDLPTVSNLQIENTDASYSYVVSKTGSGYQIEATGFSANAQKSVRVNLAAQESQIEYGVFSNGEISLKNSAYLGVYNLSPEQSFQVITNATGNGDVSLKSSSYVDGDIFVGAGGDPAAVIDKNSAATITGDMDSISSPYTPAPVVVPQELENLVSSGDLSNDVTLTGNAKYDEIKLRNGETITVDGEVTIYVTGEVELKNSASIVINPANPDAKLIIYVDGDFVAKNDSTVNVSTEDTHKFTLYGTDTCDKVEIKNSASYYGSIYAPEAGYVMDGFSTGFGSVTADTYEQKNSSIFKYDASLAQASEETVATGFEIAYWSEN